MTIKRAWLILGFVTAVTASVAIIKNKIAATLLGPEGVGIYSQANVFIVFATTICSIGLGQGIVKHLAERQKADIEGISRREIVGTSLGLQLVLTAALVVAILLLQPLIADLVFGKAGLSKYVLVTAAAVPLTLLFLNLGYLLQGTNQILKYSLATSANVIVGLFVFIWLIWTYGLDGAVLGLLSSAAVSVLVFGWFSRKPILDVWHEKRNTGFARIFSKKVGKILLLYGIATFIGGFLETFNALVLRSWIVNRVGASDNGIYQAVLSLSGQYIGFFTLFNATYLFPKLSALRDNKDIGIEINKAIQLGAFFLTPFLATVLIFREEIILLLFTPAFLTASSILVWQVLGDFVKVSSWFVSASLLPTGRLREYVILSIVYAGLSLLLSFGFLMQWETIGIAIAHFCTYILYFCLVLAVQRKVIDLRFSMPTFRFLVFSSGTLLFAAFFPGQAAIDYALKLFVVLLWSCYAIWEMRFYLRTMFENRFPGK